MAARVPRHDAGGSWIRQLVVRFTAVCVLATVAASCGAVGSHFPAPGVAAEGHVAAAGCSERVSPTHPIDRVAGVDRYATAACVSRTRYPDVTDGTVVIARGDAAGGFADALAGTVLAHAVDGPTLLTDPARLPGPTADELRRLRPRRVVVLGGPVAVHDTVITAIRQIDSGVTVERIGGADRYATAAEVSERSGAGGTAFVVNGRAPADALVAGAPAARMGAKLLLTTGTSVPPVTAAEVDGVDEVVIVGGYRVVGESVERALAARVGRGRVTRVSGGTRYDTATAVARHFPEEGRTYLVAGSDRSIVDALAAGWAASLPDGGPVLYSERDRPGAGTDRYLRLGGLSADDPLRLIGGTTVLSDRLVDVLEARYVEAAAGGPPTQMRGVWAHLFDATLKSRPGIDAMLDRVAAANLNTVIVEVVRRQDAYYASDVLPRTSDPALAPDLDVLARVVAAARDRGLEVHAWFPALPAWHPVYEGLDLPLWEAHGVGSPEPWVSVDARGRQGTFFDPGVPEVADHVVAVARELARAYPVDAVHVDYLRYESQEWGYHPDSLTRFRTAYDLPSTFVPPVEGDWRWDAWRREQTRAVAERVRDAVHAARPTTAVTLAGSTIGEPPVTPSDYTNTQTWGDVFQAWPQWLATGLVDAVFPMNYFRESSHARWYDGWLAFERRLDIDCDVVRPPCVLAVGQAAYLNSPAESLSQIGDALAATDGVVVYSYQQNAVDGSVLPRLPATVLREPAPAPALR